MLTSQQLESQHLSIISRLEIDSYILCILENPINHQVEVKIVSQAISKILPNRDILGLVSRALKPDDDRHGSVGRKKRWNISGQGPNVNLNAYSFKLFWNHKETLMCIWLNQPLVGRNKLHNWMFSLTISKFDKSRLMFYLLRNLILKCLEESFLSPFSDQK